MTKQILIDGNHKAFCEYIRCGDNIDMDILLADKAISDRFLKYVKNMGENDSLALFFECLMEHWRTEQAKEQAKETTKQILIDGDDLTFAYYLWALMKDNNPPSFAMDILFEERVLDRFFKLLAHDIFPISWILETILRTSQRDNTETIGGERIEVLIRNSNLSPEEYTIIEHDYLISRTNDHPALKEALRQALDKKN